MTCRRAAAGFLAVMSVSAFAATDGLDSLDPEVARTLREARSNTEANVAELESAAEKRDAWGRLGMFFHSQHLPYAAEGFYTRALAQAESARWRYLRGIVLGEQGKLEGAIADYAKTVALEPGDFAAWYRLGAGQLVAGEIDAAEHSLGMARKLMPDAAIVLVALGDCALARGQLEEARDLYDEARERAPEATQIAYKLATVYRRLGDTARAREWLERRGSTNTQPVIDDPVLLEVAQLSRSERFYVRAGEWALERGDVDRALEAFSQAVRLAPEDEVAGYGYAEALTAAGRLDDAVAEVERVLEGHASSARGWYTLGWLLQDEPAAALDAVRRSLALAEDAKARSLAGALAMKSGRFEEARADYAMLTSAESSQAYYQYWLGMALAANGDCEARWPMLRALAIEPGWGEAHMSLARMHAICGDAAQAEARAAALLRARDDPDTRLTLAFALLARGRPDDARRIADDAGGHADARLLLDALNSGRAPERPFALGSPRWIPAEARSLHRK